MIEDCWKCMGRGGWYYDEDPNTDDWTALLFSSEWYTCYECNGTGKEKDND